MSRTWMQLCPTAERATLERTVPSLPSKHTQDVSPGFELTVRGFPIYCWLPTGNGASPLKWMQSKLTNIPVRCACTAAAHPEDGMVPRGRGAHCRPACRPPGGATGKPRCSNPTAVHANTYLGHLLIFLMQKMTGSVHSRQRRGNSQVLLEVKCSRVPGRSPRDPPS